MGSFNSILDPFDGDMPAAQWCVTWSAAVEGYFASSWPSCLSSLSPGNPLLTGGHATAEVLFQSWAGLEQEFKSLERSLSEVSVCKRVYKAVGGLPVSLGTGCGWCWVYGRMLWLPLLISDITDLTGFWELTFPKEEIKSLAVGTQFESYQSQHWWWAWPCRSCACLG